MRTKSTVTIKPAKNKQSQAALWNFMKSLAGQKAVAICEQCGGLSKHSDGPEFGKCDCKTDL